MSFIAAVLLLNMDVADAFICFANLLNRPILIAFFRLDEALVRGNLNRLNSLAPVRHRINFKIARTTFKILHHQQPLYLAQILPRYTLSRSLRSSSPITISAPLRKTSMAISKSFSSTASRVWNKLPTHVSSALTLPVFRRHLKHNFFIDAYPGFTAPTIKIESFMPST